MTRTDDVDRLKVLSKRIAEVRQELAGLRAERDEVQARLRILPASKGGDAARMAVKVAYGEDGEGLFLAEIPKGRGMPSGDAPPVTSPVDPDVKDR